MLKSVEIFTGAGGLAVGAHLAGFSTELFVEKDKWACDTLRENAISGLFQVSQHEIFEGDVTGYDWSSVSPDIDLVAGGPPCQPFSVGGTHNGANDKRDMFPEMIRAIKEISPRSFVIENVKGLTRDAFANYYQHILLRLKYPNIDMDDKKSFFDRLIKLQEHDLKQKHTKSENEYVVLPTIVNSADYGVPQRRERVFIVGFRKDLDIEWSFPEKTHSYNSLLYEQYVTKSYWKRHDLPIRRAPQQIKAKLGKIEEEYEKNPLRPWLTVRDALIGLGSPDPKKSSLINHNLQRGAKSYKGHTGSPLDMPAKALKAGVHGVPGGENMLVRDNRSVRYFSTREAARIQTFPDSYKFNGSWTEIMRQLGNAVPVHLARTVVSSVGTALLYSDFRRQEKLVSERYPRLASVNG